MHIDQPYDRNTGSSFFENLSIPELHVSLFVTEVPSGVYSEMTKKRIDLLRNFGFIDETTMIEPGINAKM